MSIRLTVSKPLRQLAAAAVALCALGSCSNSDDNRVPPYPVRISFVTVGDWNVYGVGGALDYRYFTKSNPTQPADFPYTMLSETGFGGVLLVGDILGQPRAYDLACPVEAKRDVRIYVDREKSVGVCPVCHSTYEVFELGNAISGEAAAHGYSLRQYSVAVGLTGTEYAVIRN